MVYVTQRSYFLNNDNYVWSITYLYNFSKHRITSDNWEKFAFKMYGLPGCELFVQSMFYSEN